MYHVDEAGVGFHTKGYLFRESGIYRIIIGSSNMTQTALSTNMEWNTQLVSTEQGEMAQSIVKEFEMLWTDDVSYTYEEFSEVYRKEYKHKKQIKEHEAARWLNKKSMDDVDWLPADITLIEKIREKM